MAQAERGHTRGPSQGPKAGQETPLTDKLSRSARLYLLGVLAAGGALLIWQLSQLTAADLGLALGVGGLAALAQVFKVEGPTERSSYNLSWVGYGFAFLLLGAPSAVLVIVLSHLAEWLKHRYPWYIQSFNIAQFVVAASAAALVQGWAAATLPAAPARRPRRQRQRCLPPPPRRTSAARTCASWACGAALNWIALSR